MTTYYNKYNPTLSLDPTAKDLAAQQGGASDITFEQRLANSGYAPMQSPTATSGATTQKTVNAADLMAGRVDANGNPTVGQAYAGLIPSSDPNLEAAYSAQGKMFQDATAPVDENTIRSNTQARFQAEVDALNRVYAEKKAQAAIQGEGRLGQGTAINARRGLIGSDFGNAQNAKIADQNMQVQNDIQDELSMKIAGINSKIASSVAEEFAAKQAARQQGAQQYIDFLKGAAQRKDDRTTTAVGSLVGNGITPDESVFANMASQLGTTVDDVKLKYNAAKSAYDAKNVTTQPKAQEVSAGAALVDPVTGRVIYQGTSNVANDKPVSLSPGEILVDPATGKAIFTAPNKPTDNKPITQVVNKQLLQYDPATNKWNVVRSASAPGSNSPNPPGTQPPTTLSDQARAVIDGVLRIEDLTPTVRSKIAGELTRAGYKSGPKLSAGQQQDNENMATVNSLIDEVLNYNSDGLLEGVGGLGQGSVGQFFSNNLGTGSEESRQVRSLVGNIRGTIAKLRGGTSFTASEEALLNQYVPTINESPASIVSKLNGLKKFIALKKENTTASAQERGVQKTQPALPTSPQQTSLRTKYKY
jgi:hypothetical protein